MNETILDFLTKNRVSSLTTLLPDGTPHGAALHYSHIAEPLTLYFSTKNTSRKCEGLLNGETSKASVVIGFSEDEWITLQLDGEVKALEKDQLENIHKVHYAKHPNSEQFKDAPETVFLAFTPTWWRYTDHNTKPETIISSD